MKYTFLLLLFLLSSCATQRQAEKFFNEHPEELAAYVDQNDAYTQTYGKAYSARHFPPRHYPPAVFPVPGLRPDRLQPIPALSGRSTRYSATAHHRCPVCPPAATTRTVFLPDTLWLDSLKRELKVERLANQALRSKLQHTEADRDYWREMNRKKRWAIIAMIIFALLYILFKVLAHRSRESEA